MASLVLRSSASSPSTEGTVGVEFAVEAAAAGEELALADRLPLGAGLAAYLVAMAAIRFVNHHRDWIAAMRLATAGLCIALALVGFGLGPLSFVAMLAALLVAEAATELTRGSPGPTQDDT